MPEHLKLKIINLRTFIRNVIHHINSRDVQLMVYALSFVTILSFIPFLVIVLGIFKWSGFLNLLYPKVEAILLKNFSGITSAQISSYLRTLLKRSYTGSWGIYSVAFLILTTTRLTAYFEKAVNRIWRVKNHHNIIRRFFSYWVLIMLFPIAITFDVLLRTYISQFLDDQITALIISFFFITLVLFAIYKWFPNHQVNKKPALISAIITALTLVITQNSFRFITQKSFTYSKFYGSLAALPLFMIWISIIWMVILLGVSLCAGLQKGLEQNEHH
jgi:membrane protein